MGGIREEVMMKDKPSGYNFKNPTTSSFCKDANWKVLITKTSMAQARRIKLNQKEKNQAPVLE
jgi:hypothetical protein